MALLPGAWVALAAWAVASPQSATAASCCVEGGGPGCSPTECRACVCAADPFCCQVQWDIGCVDCAEGGPGFFDACAQASCAPACPDCDQCGNGYCGALESATTCAADCPGPCGDGECGLGEDCTTCPADCGGCAGGCCEAHDLPGCVDAACMACACTADAFCCDVGWDIACVEAAYGTCAAACPCAGTPGGQSCCAAHDEPGCSDPTCQGCVCARDGFCCDASWDFACVDCALGGPGFGDACADERSCDAACSACGACGDGVCQASETSCTCPADCVDACGDGCCTASEQCTTCPLDCGGCDVSCCDVNGAQGCSDVGCAACVCETDPYCCAVGWDSACVAGAFAACSGTCACTAQGGQGSCCSAHEDAGCDTPACQSCVCALDGFCCAVSWDLACADCAEGGGGYLDACGGGPCVNACEACDLCGNGFCAPGETACSCPQDCDVACGDGCCIEGETCAGCPEDCGGCSGSCCDARLEPGCGDVECQQCVCDSDPFCCDTAWDIACADCAVGGDGFEGACSLALCDLPCVGAYVGCPSGDITGDPLINVVDVQCSILVALGQLAGTVPPCLEGESSDADLDCDGAVTVGDVVSVIRANLGVPLDPQVDADGDGCPDTCPTTIGCAGE